MMIVRVAAGAAGVVVPEALPGVVAAVVVRLLSLPQAASRMPSASGVIKVFANLTRSLLVRVGNTRSMDRAAHRIVQGRDTFVTKMAMARFCYKVNVPVMLVGALG
ncbi:hypothetical protein ASC93_09205 [Massilia sp. Root335]|nr:hypothetical protein ASC93_09205 [Massilia sp. Root335]